MTNKVWVCPHCGKPVARHVIWRQPNDVRVNYCCEQHEAVIPVLETRIEESLSF